MCHLAGRGGKNTRRFKKMLRSGREKLNHIFVFFKKLSNPKKSVCPFIPLLRCILYFCRLGSNHILCVSLSINQVCTNTLRRKKQLRIIDPKKEKTKKENDFFEISRFECQKKQHGSRQVLRAWQTKR